MSPTESVLHARGLPTEPQLVGGASLHPADGHDLCSDASVAVEGELHLLGLAREEKAVQGEDVKHLREGSGQTCDLET